MRLLISRFRARRLEAWSRRTDGDVTLAEAERKAWIFGVRQRKVIERKTACRAHEKNSLGLSVPPLGTCARSFSGSVLAVSRRGRVATESDWILQPLHTERPYVHMRVGGGVRYLKTHTLTLYPRWSVQTDQDSARLH